MANARPRRAKGTGSISPRKDGRVDAELKVRDWDGSVKRYRTTKNTETEADRWLTRVKYEHERDMLLADGAERITLGEFLDTWLKESVEGIVSKHSYDAYESKVRVHIKPAIGRVRLKDLTTRHLQTLYRKKTEEGLGWRSVRYIHTTMLKALDQAEGWDLVRKNVAKWAKPPREEVDEDKPVMSVAQARAFLEAIKDDRLEALYILAVTTGMRRGEMLGLKWSDIDLEKGTLLVSRSSPTATTTKTRKRRPAVLPPPVVAALKRQKARLAREKFALGPMWREHGLVFPTTIGTPALGGNVLTRSLKPLMEGAGLPPYNFQALRRSTATFLVLLKIYPRTAQRWMGHSSITTTMNVYAQAPDELQEEAAKLMGELFFGKEKADDG